MHNIVKCWWYKEDFLDNFEIIEVNWDLSSESGQYFIDNTLRRQRWT